MHVLFVHQNFPAQFGHIAQYLANRNGFRCTFVTEKKSGMVGNVELVQYKVCGGATRATHYCSRTFENATWHAHAIFEAMRGWSGPPPDLIVGHSGFGPTIFLNELYPDCPIINYFEYFYHARGSDIDFRPDFPSQEIDRLRARNRNAMLMLDLENCTAGYSPTQWQKDRFPATYHPKIRVIFDGIDCNIWRPDPAARTPVRHIGNLTISQGTKIVTYATRGMESMRGFDIFMKAAKKICDIRSDVVFLIAGQDRVCYGGDTRFTGGKTFKEWVLAQDDYDLSRFHFLGLLPPQELARLFAITDLHFYLTVPFVLSWSLINALACGATVLASDTAPVREVIEHQKTGLLVDFFDIDGFVANALAVLHDPEAFRPLGAQGHELVRQSYSLDVCLPQMLKLYEESLAGNQKEKT